MAGMDTPDFADFEHEARARGYTEVLARTWEPGVALDDHSHPFDAWALVIAGEMWLTVGGETRHLAAGDRFEVPQGTPHAERYGPHGATYWVARRTQPG